MAGNVVCVVDSTSYLWMTNEYFEDILAKIEDEAIKVQNFELREALGKGENYGSKILRVKINYCGSNGAQRSKNLIVKAAVGDQQKQDMMEKIFFVFTREIAAYNDVLPAVNQLLLKAGQCWSDKLAPEMYAFGHSPNFLVFEDLTANGYKLVDRVKGLDFEHLKFCLNKVAKFHACTAVLLESNPSLFVNHRYKNVNKRDSAFHGFMKGCLLQTALRAKTWKGCEILGAKLEALEKVIIDKTSEAFDNEHLKFSVLNHGDLWNNNMMWKHDEAGQPIDCVLVDYAIGFVGSPGIDLSYLLLSSSSNEIKDREFDLLLQHYHKQLTKCLEAVGFKGQFPTLLDIHCEFLKRGYNGLIFTSVLLPLRFLENTENADLNGLLDDTDSAKEFRKQMFETPHLEARMRFLLDFYDRKGFLG